LPFSYLPGGLDARLYLDDVYCAPTFREVSRTLAIAPEGTVSAAGSESQLGARKPEKAFAAGRSSGSSVTREVYLHEALYRSGQVAIIGAMGTGKSMVAQRITSNLAAGRGQSEYGLPPNTVPIMVRLGDVPARPEATMETVALDAAARQVPEADRQSTRSALAAEWQAGRVILILDAVDEYPGRLGWIRAELTNLRAASVRTVLTSRPAAYEQSGIHGSDIAMADLAESESRLGYIRRWASALAQLPDLECPDPVGFANNLEARLLDQPLVRELAGNRLLLSLLIVLTLQDRSLDLGTVRSRAWLLRDYLNQVAKWEAGKGRSEPGLYGIKTLLDVLGVAGFLVHLAATSASTGGDTGQAVSFWTVRDVVAGWPGCPEQPSKSAAAEAILEFWLRTGFIFKDGDANGTLRFRHLAFQYLAAAIGWGLLEASYLRNLPRNPLQAERWGTVRELFEELRQPDVEFKQV